MKTFSQWLEQQVGAESPQLHMYQQMLAQLKYQLAAQPSSQDIQKRVQEIEGKIKQLGGDPAQAPSLPAHPQAAPAPQQQQATQAQAPTQAV